MKPLWILLATFAATPAVAQTFPQIACSGVFARDTNHAAMVAALGAQNVTYEEIPGPEGSTEQATVLYGKDPKRRLEVNWNDAEKRSRIVMIHIADKSAWVAPLGVKIGSTLEEVEKLNGKPFKMAGFDWDYGGHATFAKDSPLSKVPGGCTVSVRFRYTAPGGRTAKKIIGDKQVMSNLPEMRASKPKVTDVYIGYAPPD